MEAQAQSFEQPLLAGVPDRVSCRVRAQPDVKADAGPEGRVLADRGGPRAGLDPLDNRSRESTRSAQDLAAQARALPRPDEICADARFILGGNPGRSSDGTHSSCHRWIMARPSSLAIHCASRGHYIVPRGVSASTWPATKAFGRRYARELSNSEVRERSDRRTARFARNERGEASG